MFLDPRTCLRAHKSHSPARKRSQPEELKELALNTDALLFHWAPACKDDWAPSNCKSLNDSTLASWEDGHKEDTFLSWIWTHTTRFDWTWLDLTYRNHTTAAHSLSWSPECITYSAPHLDHPFANPRRRSSRGLERLYPTGLTRSDNTDMGRPRPPGLKIQSDKDKCTSMDVCTFILCGYYSSKRLFHDLDLSRGNT